MGKCRYCGKSAGFMYRKHNACHTAHQAGMRRIRQMAADAAISPDFNETTLQTEAEGVAAEAFLSDGQIRQAMADGWGLALQHGLSDGVLTREEEVRLRAFRDKLALQPHELPQKEWRKRNVAIRDRLVTEAAQAAMATDNGRSVAVLADHLADSPLSPDERKSLLVTAWEAAVERSLEDGLLSIVEEHALLRYLNRLDLSPQDVGRRGAYGSMVKSAVIRDAAEGVVPNRLGAVSVPFNLMKSEKLVWLIKDVDYLEVKVRRERRGTSHGLTLRVAKGVYYRPSAFRSHTVEREETVHQDTGLLGITTKHIYFHGGRKRFRIRYDRIVSFEPYDDGVGVMREAQSATPQTFRTGDGWFAYNLVTNLARHW